MRSLVSAGALGLGLCGCGGASPPTGPPPVIAPSATSSARAEIHPTDRTLRRSSISAAVAQGLGALLQRVELDEKPVLVRGRFHGFRVAALHDPTFWNGVDLKPGDVVTGLNGLPIERPEQAQTAFESLQVASELRVSYDRDGEPRELVYSIVDDR